MRGDYNQVCHCQKGILVNHIFRDSLYTSLVSIDVIGRGLMWSMTILIELPSWHFIFVNIARPIVRFASGSTRSRRECHPNRIFFQKIAIVIWVPISTWWYHGTSKHEMFWFQLGFNSSCSELKRTLEKQLHGLLVAIVQTEAYTWRKATLWFIFHTIWWLPTGRLHWQWWVCSLPSSTRRRRIVWCVPTGGKRLSCAESYLLLWPVSFYCRWWCC